MPRRPRSFALALALALGVLGSSAPADAQEGVPLPKFNPAPAGDRFFGVPSPYAAGDPVAPHVMLLGDYAHAPLAVVRTNADGSRDTLATVVEHQLVLHLNGGVALFDRLNINLDLPLFLVQEGTSYTPAGLVAANAFSLGDLRLGVRARIFGEYEDGFQLGLGGYLWLPTSAATKDAARYVSDQNVRGLPQIYLGGLVDRFVWSSVVGVEARADNDFPSAAGGGVQQVSQSLRFDAGVGLGVRLGDKRQFQLGPEATIGVDLRRPSANNVNVEALLGAKWRFIDDMEAGVAVGPGLTRGMGTPDVRAVASLAYTPLPKKKRVDRDKDGVFDDDDACPDVAGVASDDPKKHGCPPPSDRDKDGIVDRDDACPDVAGFASDDPKKHGCPPPPDRDKDGIPDADDACAELPGIASEDPKRHGCPSDKDGDGVYDLDDACVDVPGVKTDDKATNGCPPDTDGDGFRDDKDACPREKGVDDPDPTKRGCPKAVRVSENEIIILQQVQFDTAKAVIKKESDALLDEVAGVLKEHPELDLLEVQGHTDGRAARTYNLQLSADRAKAVVKALEKRGVEAKRLTAKGYGPDRPIAGNDTDEGRQKNRRVQFIVLSKNGKPVAQKDQPQGAAGQPDAPKKPVTGVAPKPPAPKAPAPKKK